MGLGAGPMEAVEKFMLTASPIDSLTHSLDRRDLVLLQLGF